MIRRRPSPRPKAIWTQAFPPKPTPEKLRPQKKPRLRVRPVSKVRSARLREYSRAVALWKLKPENKMCRYPGCDRKTTDCHHSRGRVGALLLDERWWVPVCARHHDWIHANPAEARDIGMIAAKGDWNTSPEDRNKTLDRNRARLQDAGQAIRDDGVKDGFHPNAVRREVASDGWRGGDGSGSGPNHDAGPPASGGSEAS